MWKKKWKGGDSQVPLLFVKNAGQCMQEPWYLKVKFTLHILLPQTVKVSCVDDSQKSYWSCCFCSWYFGFQKLASMQRSVYLLLSVFINKHISCAEESCFWQADYIKAKEFTEEWTKFFTDGLWTGWSFSKFWATVTETQAVEEAKEECKWETRTSIYCHTLNRFITDPISTYK